MIYEWPKGAPFCPIEGSFQLRAVSQVSTSPYTGAIKGLAMASIWVARLSFDPGRLGDAIAIQSFVEMLEGPSHPVMMFDRWRPEPRLLASGKWGFTDGTLFHDGTGFTDGYEPLVIASESRGARSVAISALPVSQQCFERGDLIGVGGHLYEVRASAISNAAGEARLSILPGLRAGVAAGDPVTLWNPTVAMRLASASGVEFARNNNTGAPIELTFVEDIA